MLKTLFGTPKISRDDEGDDVVTSQSATPIIATPNLSAQPLVNSARSASSTLPRKTDIPLAKLVDYSLGPEEKIV
jgi:hypothetical protein